MVGLNFFFDAEWYWYWWCWSAAAVLQTNIAYYYVDLSLNRTSYSMRANRSDILE